MSRFEEFANKEALAWYSDPSRSSELLTVWNEAQRISNEITSNMRIPAEKLTQVIKGAE